MATSSVAGKKPIGMVDETGFVLPFPHGYEVDDRLPVRYLYTKAEWNAAIKAQKAAEAERVHTTTIETMDAEPDETPPEERPRVSTKSVAEILSQP